MKLGVRTGFNDWLCNVLLHSLYDHPSLKSGAGKPTQILHCNLWQNSSELLIIDGLYELNVNQFNCTIPDPLTIPFHGKWGLASKKVALQIADEL